MSKILAIDLGKFKSVSCLLNTENNETEFWTLETSRHYLETVLKHYAPDLVVIESCAIAAWVHDVCREAGFEVLVCNPSQEAWKWKNVKRKTDKDDALKLAKLAALEQLVPVHIPAQQMREHRWLVRYRKTLQGRINRVQNSIRALFNQRGLKLPVGQRAWRAAGLAEIVQQRRPLMDCPLAELWRVELDLELTELQRLGEELKAVDRKLEELAEQDERVKLLETIPGVGRKTAEVIVTHLDKPERFATAGHVSSYAGLIPRRFQSGQMDRQGGISHRGSRLLRSALVECAWIMLKYNPWARNLYQRLCYGQKTRKKKAIVAVARKLLVCSWAMLRDNRPWQPGGVGSPANQNSA
jgi:transposase